MSVEELKKMVLEEFKRRDEIMAQLGEKLLELAEEDPFKALEFIDWFLLMWWSRHLKAAAGVLEGIAERIPDIMKLFEFSIE